jgi:hypothetical protein
MGIELPSELADVAAQAGVRWPRADEDGMRQAAAAWREAGNSMHTLASDTDGSARHALDAVHGDTGDAARRHWDGFVGPSGHLPTAAKGCHAAADRLEHAADQVGAAKVQIVRHLVTLAKNRDAAHQAAAAGHPTALAGLDTAVRGTAANVADVHHTLTQSVRLDGGVDVGAVPALVHASPGATPFLPPGGDHRGVPPPGGGVAPVPLAAGLISGPVEYAGGAGQPLAAGPIGAGAGTVTGPVTGAAGGAFGPASGLPGAGSGHQPVEPHQMDPESTGPIPVGHGGPGAEGWVGGGFGPTGGAGTGVPSVNPEHTAASAANLVHQSSAGPVEPPPAVAEHAEPGVGAQPVPAAGQPGAAGLGGAGGLGGSTEPAPGGAVGATPGGSPAAGPVGRPEPGGGLRAGRSASPGADVLVSLDSRDRTVPRPAIPHASPAGRPGPPPPRPARPQDPSAGPIALFVAHMFPIGHLPVPTGRPARQRRPPAPELDYAAGLRFAPQDHPESALVDDGPAMHRALDGQPPAESAPARAANDPVVAALAEGHDSLGGAHERDWDRRFLVRAGQDGQRAEYAWPPAERYPEGGSDVGEPVVLPEGTVLDRFGTPEGRVLAPADTPFRRRSLPPEYLADGYHRYRVLRPLPVWRAVSAAWFGQPGGGERYRATYPVADLVALGWLAAVTNPEAAGTNPEAAEVTERNEETGG